MASDHCREVANEISAQVRLAIDQLPSEATTRVLSLVILGGEGAQEKGLVDVTAESLLCRIELANPFKGMALAKDLDPFAIDQDAPLLMMACGLAMREPSR